MRNSFLSVPAAILLISLPVLVVLFAVPPSPHILEIVRAEDGGQLFQVQVVPGDRFKLEYVHSVQLSCVTDEFEIDHRYRITLVATTFSDHGAGLPDRPHRGGSFSVQEDGKFRISGMRVTLSEILLRTGHDYDNVFECETRRINLSNRYGDALLVIRTRNYSAIKRLLRRMLNVG